MTTVETERTDSGEELLCLTCKLPIGDEAIAVMSGHTLNVSKLTRICIVY